MAETKEIRNHLSANSHISKKNIIVGNFLGGMAWGLGTVVGAGVLLAIIGSILHAVGIFDAATQFFNSLPRTGK